MASFHESHLPVHHRLSLRNISSIITESLWVLLLCLLSCSLTMSAPTNLEYWINPCGLEEYEVDSVPNTSPQTLLDLYKDVIVNAEASHKQIAEVKEDLLAAVELTEDSMERYTYAWLPVPAANDVHYFKKLNRDDAVKDSYNMLQTYAVAFEQISKDYEAKSGDDTFSVKVEQMRIRSVQLLCSMQLAMAGLKITPRDPPRRSAMPEDLKNLTHSKQLLRNFIIARDYMKVAFYVKELFKYFSSVMEN